jgi:hypothetical protein
VQQWTVLHSDLLRIASSQNPWQERAEKRDLITQSAIPKKVPKKSMRAESISESVKSIDDSNGTSKDHSTIETLITVSNALASAKGSPLQRQKQAKPAATNTQFRWRGNPIKFYVPILIIDS